MRDENIFPSVDKFEHRANMLHVILDTREF